MSGGGTVLSVGRTDGAFPGFTNRGQYDAFVALYLYGDEDAFVLRVASNGELIDGWQVGTPAADTVRALAITACGDVIVAGATAGELVQGSALGANDAFLLRVPLEIRP